ncbi:hypothetical protein Hdeb2414_s0009g00306671 [Helianthus debilis subsp. tardiflorus]
MIPVLPFYTCFICFLPIFSNISKEIYRHRKETGEKRCERKQKEREREIRSRRISGNRPHLCSPPTHRNEVAESRFPG